MKQKQDSYVLELYRKEFDLIADFIKGKLCIDVRENTKSRANNLPRFRCLFFAIAIKSTKADLATMGGYLDKDHATVCHAKTMWENGVKSDLGAFLLAYLKIKQEKKEPTTSDLVLGYEIKIKNLQDRILALKIKTDITISNVLRNARNESLRQLLDLDNATTELFISTRLEPFLKMNKMNGKRKMKIVEKLPS